MILCEDTRVTKKLLRHYQIGTPTLSYHQHSKLKKTEYIIELLKGGASLALVSDAGTPGISDPGNELIARIVSSFAPDFSGLRIVPAPGPSALIAAASVSGFPAGKFLFLGFPPAKKKRKKFFAEILSANCQVLFYESPYRIVRTLKELAMEAEVRGLNPDIVLCRELTKKFETIYRGRITSIAAELKEGIRGEFVVAINGTRKNAGAR